MESAFDTYAADRYQDVRRHMDARHNVSHRVHVRDLKLGYFDKLFDVVSLPDSTVIVDQPAKQNARWAYRPYQKCPHEEVEQKDVGAAVVERSSSALHCTNRGALVWAEDQRLYAGADPTDLAAKHELLPCPLPDPPTLLALRDDNILPLGPQRSNLTLAVAMDDCVQLLSYQSNAPDLGPDHDYPLPYGTDDTLHGRMAPEPYAEHKQSEQDTGTSVTVTPLGTYRAGSLSRFQTYVRHYYPHVQDRTVDDEATSVVVATELLADNTWALRVYTWSGESIAWDSVGGEDTPSLLGPCMAFRGNVMVSGGKAHGKHYVPTTMRYVRLVQRIVDGAVQLALQTGPPSTVVDPDDDVTLTFDHGLHGSQDSAIVVARYYRTRVGVWSPIGHCLTVVPIQPPLPEDVYGGRLPAVPTDLWTGKASDSKIRVHARCEKLRWVPVHGDVLERHVITWKNMLYEPDADEADLQCIVYENGTSLHATVALLYWMYHGRPLPSPLPTAKERKRYPRVYDWLDQSEWAEFLRPSAKDPPFNRAQWLGNVLFLAIRDGDLKMQSDYLALLMEHARDSPAAAKEGLAALTALLDEREYVKAVRGRMQDDTGSWYILSGEDDFAKEKASVDVAYTFLWVFAYEFDLPLEDIVLDRCLRHASACVMQAIYQSGGLPIDYWNALRTLFQKCRDRGYNVKTAYLATVMYKTGLVVLMQDSPRTASSVEDEYMNPQTYKKRPIA